MEGDRAHAGKQGFTLIEVLAALAIASVIIGATAGLMRHVVLTFDRGTSRVSGADRLVLAAERLAADVGSARFVLQTNPAGAAVAFVGGPTKITFIGAGGINPGQRGSESASLAEEVVSVAVERADDTTQIVRRRAIWRGPRARLDDAVLQDAVVLVAGRFDAAFAFARMKPEGALTWSNSWAGEQILPRLVKLSLRERATGIDLLGGGEFVVRADASGACARPGAGANCLSGAPDAAADPSKPQQPQRTSP
jgi:prepilin-type N-terminal cleavage/methylation domain-containing protein